VLLLIALSSTEELTTTVGGTMGSAGELRGGLLHAPRAEAWSRGVLGSGLDMTSVRVMTAAGVGVEKEEEEEGAGAELVSPLGASLAAAAAELPVGEL